MSREIKTFYAEDALGNDYKINVIQTYQTEKYMDGSVDYIAQLPEIRLENGEPCNLVDKDNGVLRIVSNGVELKAIDWKWNLKN